MATGIYVLVEIVGKIIVLMPLIMAVVLFLMFYRKAIKKFSILWIYAYIWLSGISGIIWMFLSTFVRDNYLEGISLLFLINLFILAFLPYIFASKFSKEALIAWGVLLGMPVIGVILFVGYFFFFL